MKLCKKILSFCLACTFISGMYVSPAVAEDINYDYLTAGCVTEEIILEDNFENGLNDKNYKVYPADNSDISISVKNGKLNFSKTSSSDSYAACNILPYANGKSLDSDFYLFEADVSKADKARAYIWLSHLDNPEGSGSVDFARLRYTDGKFFDDKSKSVLSLSGSEHHLAFLADIKNGRYYVTIDGQALTSGSDALYMPTGGINSMRLILPLGGEHTNINIDNLKISRVSLRDELSAKIDADYLSYESVVRIAHESGDVTLVNRDLNLPTSLSCGSSVVWESSDSSLIETDGTVHPSAENKNVTLTAYIKKGSVEIKKEFEFVVTNLDESSDKLFYDAEEVILEDDFEDGTLGSKYLLYGGDSGNTHGSLEVKNGELQLRWNNTNAAGAYFRIVPADKVLSNGIYSFEFDIKKSADVPVRMIIEGNDSKYDIARFSLQKSKIWEESVRDGKTQNTSDGFYNHVSILVDTANGYYYAWIDGKELVYRAEGLYGADAVRSIKIMLSGGMASHYVAIDNLKVCRADAQRYLSNQSKIRIDKDFEALSDEFISKEALSNVTSSLNLVSKAPNGSHVSWKSSDISVVDNTGRVTRPAEYESDAKLTLTATITHGKEKMEKKFSIKVPADEVFTDPDIMTDEEFFGVWDNATQKFSVEGKFDYSYSSGLSSTLDCVKRGDYEGAKVELLKYFRERNPKSTLDTGKRNLLAANLYSDGWLFSEHNYYDGEMYAGDEFADSEGDIITSNLVAGDINCLLVAPWYNEASWCEIYGVDAANPEFRPRLKVVADGKERTYYAKDDAVIRAGQYMESHYEPGSEILKIRKFGEYLSDEEYNILLKFDLKDLSASAKIESAKLILRCRTDIDSPNGKRLFIMREPSNGWNGNTVEWRNVNGFIYNNNGLPEIRNWDQWAPHCNTEYGKQVARFAPMKSTAIEYRITKDEYYAYNTIKALGDFINDFGAWVPTPEPGTFGNFKPVEDNTVRGQYPRTLDTCGRLKSICAVFDILCRSESMSPEYSTAILKHAWDIAHSLRAYHCIQFHNWQMIEMQSMYTVAEAFPEFIDCVGDDGENWRDYGYDTLANYLLVGYLDDGTYAEDTGGYSHGVLTSYTGIAEQMEKDGYVMPEAAREKMHKATYYNLLLRAPNGHRLGYGDEPQKMWADGVEMFSAFSDLFDDQELKYIDSFGKYGKEPSWTSRHFPLGKVTFMRSNWSTNTPYMFSAVRGHINPSHSHYDDNHVIVYAYGNILLSDQGTFNYDSTPERIWGRSSEGHNTVTINDANQIDNVVNGEVHKWTANDAFDYLSQSTYANPGVTHTRSIFFAKPSYYKTNYWIVSDFMNPENDSVQNNYKQHWHMRPDANYSDNTDKRQIYSNFEKGGNIIVASADGNDVTGVNEDGYWSIDYGNVMPTKWGYFEKNAVGDTTFNTVLVPYENENASVNVQSLDLGVPKTIAEALVIDVNANAEKSKDYYYISHESTPSLRSFSNYTTNAQNALVSNTESGSLRWMALSGGTILKANNNVLIDTGNVIMDISVEISDGTMYVSCDKDADLSKIVINPMANVTKVYVNGTRRVFSVTDGNFSIAGVSNEIDAGFSGNGAVDRNESSDSGHAGGGFGGSGGGGASGGVSGGVYVPDSQVVPAFADISGHWAENTILSLASEGIVNGKSEGMYFPDDGLTRAEAITLIARVAKLPSYPNSISFNDVSETDWYYESVNSCLAAGIISDDYSFRPNEFISRQEITKIIMGVYLMNNENVSEDSLEFADSSDISDWAKSYVSQACALGIIKGMDNNVFAPKKGATRAEAATIISRLKSLI